MFHDDVLSVGEEVVGDGGLRQAIALWRALAPLRQKAGRIDWTKVIAFLQKIMPLLLALFDLLPQKPAGRTA